MFRFINPSKTVFFSQSHRFIKSSNHENINTKNSLCYLRLSEVHGFSIRQLFEDFYWETCTIVRQKTTVSNSVRNKLLVQLLLIWCYLLLLFVPQDLTYCTCSPNGGWDWWSSPVLCGQRRHRSAGRLNSACHRWHLLLTNMNRTQSLVKIGFVGKQLWWIY